ncbi:MAG TPA: thioredoxin family protein, partial [Flavobacteriaceae bacterium]|nr:thioredoxin family protein [Flavobacteriaceae bacterium]
MHIKLLVFLFGLNIFWINAQNIEWLTFEAALEAQKENPKKILMDVYTDWCGPCKLMDKKTFQNKDVAAYISEHYYAVKFNAEGQETINFFGNSFTNPNYDPNRKGRNATHQFTQFLGVKGYPTVIFISETGDLITPLVGYQNPQQIELYLKMIKQGDYMIFSKPDDFEKYKKSFRLRYSD